MGRRAGEEPSLDDVKNFVVNHLKMLGVVSPALTFIMLMLWNTYAQPKVDESIAIKIEPLEKRLDVVENRQKGLVFDTKQILSIL